MIDYIEANGQPMSEDFEGYWSYAFKVTKRPFSAKIKAVQVNTASSFTIVSGKVNILVDGAVVASDSSSGTGSTSVQADYVIQ